MKKIKILKYGLPVLASLLLVSCNEDDATGYSNLIVNEGVTLSVDIPFASPQNLIETNASYNYTVSISEPQPVNVVAKVALVGGTASEGDDFDFDHEVIIPAYSTSGTGSITIYQDDLIESTETFTLEVGSGYTANASITPVQFSFNIANYTEDGLNIDLTWDAGNLTDINGNSISAVEAADLRLLLTDASMDTSNPYDESDGATFENLTLDASAPDGDYYVIADFYSAVNFGDQGNFLVDLATSFNQSGIINDDDYTFEEALNSDYVCPNNYYIMNKVVKSGSTYTITSIGESALSSVTLAGTWDVVSSGTSTDSGATNNPISNYAYTVTLTETSPGVYTISDGYAGVYIQWYTVYGVTSEEEGNVSLNFCTNELTGTWEDPFGANVYLTGTFNSDGTLTIQIDNDWGDVVNATYTPQ